MCGWRERWAIRAAVVGGSVGGVVDVLDRGGKEGVRGVREGSIVEWETEVVGDIVKCKRRSGKCG